MNSSTESRRISIHQPSPQELQELGVQDWEVWEKEPSDFEYHYDKQEECYFINGDVQIVTSTGETVQIHAGDFVVFPRGLDCTWHITHAVRKHYRFS